MLSFVEKHKLDIRHFHSTQERMYDDEVYPWLLGHS